MRAGVVAGAVLLGMAGMAAGADIAAVRAADPRNISNGLRIPSEAYADQPYVVVTSNGAWVCTLTTGKGLEGQQGQHVVATVSRDQGKTWSELVAIEPDRTKSTRGARSGDAIAQVSHEPVATGRVGERGGMPRAEMGRVRSEQLNSRAT